MIQDVRPWNPMTDPVDIKHIGKIIEELGELQAALARCLIQGIDETETTTGKPNRQWLEEEIADVYANLSLVQERFKLRVLYDRVDQKITRLKSWHDMAGMGEAL